MVEIGKLYLWKYYDEEGRNVSVIVCPTRDVYVQGKFLGYFGYELDRPEQQIYISSKASHDLRDLDDITVGSW